MTRTNSAVLAELRQKLGGVSPQAIQQRRDRMTSKVAMPTDIATYVLAQREGVKLHKHLDEPMLAKVAEYESRLSAKEAGQASPQLATTAKRRKGAATRPVLVTIAGVKVDRLPGMTATHAKEAQTMSEKVYPALYVFENSARDVISKVLKDQVGDDWWDKVVPSKVRNKAAQRKADEAKDPWHGKRGAALIDYLDLSDLPSIVAANKVWPHFKALFGRVSWFQELVSEMNVSRRVAAHMNPLESDDVKNVEAAFRKWAKLLQAKQDELP